MKRKFSLLALCLAALMCCSLFLFAACETDDPTGTTNTITATLSETEVTVGETVTLTYSATEGTVTVTVSKDGGAAETVTGTTFTPDAAGTYVFTFAAEGAESKTVTVKVNAPAHVHDYSAWTVNPVPTDTEGGTATRTCSAQGCDEPTQTVTLPSLSTADAYSTQVKTAATCVAKGAMTYTYSENTDISFDVEVDISFVQEAHADLEYVAAQEATCTDGGHSAYAYCDACKNYYAVTEGSSAQDYTITGSALTDASSFAGTPKGHSYSSLSTTYNTLVAAEMKAQVACDNGCGESLTITLPAVTTENGWKLDTENDYTPPTHTQAGSGTYTYTWTDNTYTVAVTVVGVPIPAEGAHMYENVTMTAEDYAAALAKDGGDYTLPCTYSGCSVTFTFALPETSAEGWTASDVQNASCTAAGSKTLSRTVSGQDSSGQDVSITLTVTGVEIPAIPHTLVRVEGKAATCTEFGWNAYWQCSVCKEIFTADDQKSGTGKTEVTADLEGIYLAPLDHDFAGQPYVYDEENGAAGHYQVCSHGCGTKSEVIPHSYGEYLSNASGHWRVCSECSYEETGSHSGIYAFVSGSGVVFTCSVCGDDYVCKLTGIDVTAGSDAYIVDNGDGTFTAYGFTVEAVYNGIAGVATTEVFIPLTEEGLTVSVDGTYKATVTFAYGGVQDKPDGTYTVYTDTISGGTVNEIGQTAWTPYSQPLATLQGEFEYRFTLSNLQRNATKAYNSWLITLAPANGSTDAKVRPDNWVADNFGLVSGQGDGDGTDDAPNFTYTTNAEAGKYLNGFDYSGDLAFVLTRTYADGVYTTTIRVVQGSYWATFELVEPATAGNAMKVYLAADCVTYTYSDVLYAEKGLTMSSITGPAEATQVIAGTSLETALAGISLTVAYEESILTDTLAASACSITDNGGYAADTADTYTVTLSYGEFSVEVDIQVVGASTQDLVFYKNGEVVTGDQVVAGNAAARNTGGLTAYTDQALDGRIALSADTDYSSTWAGERGEFVAVKLDTSRDFTLEYTADVYTDVLSGWRAPAFMVSNGEEIASTLNGHAADLVIRGDAWTGLSSNRGVEVTLTQTVTINTNLWRYSVNTSGDPAYISEAGQDTLAAAYYTGAVTGVTTNWTVSYNAANHVFTVTVEVGDATIWSFTASSTLVTGTDMVMYIGGEGTYMNNISGTITYAAE